MQDVVHHAARVPDLEAARARLDPTHNGRADDGHLLAVGHLDQLPGVVLRDALRDDGDGSDLGELETLQSGVVSGPETGEADHDISLREGGHGVGHVLVDGHEHLLVSPVEVLLAVAGRHGVDHAGHAGLLPPAHVVEVHHALDCAGLEAPHDGAGGLGE